MSYIFWGAGKNCIKLIEVWKYMGLKPKCIIDSNCEKWGEVVGGVVVQSPEALSEIDSNDIVYVTCRWDLSIETLLRKYRVDGSQVMSYTGDGELLQLYVKQCNSGYFDVNPDVKKRNIIFDLENGMTLGGIESWVLKEGGKLRCKGWKTAYAIPGGKEVIVKGQMEFANELYDCNETDIFKKINMVAQYILQSGAAYVVSNFGYIFFYGACIAKKILHGKIKHIVVIHNDVDVFYDRYAEMREYIDMCMVISNKMLSEMEKRNFPAEKLSYLNWDIKCYSEFTRGYSAKGIPLRIGYAGRVTIRQKRLDRVFGVADALKKLGVAFRLQIAGKGDYFDTLRTAVKENGLQVEVELVGYVKNDDIQEFWIRQDIMLSCSEYEGHSITQMEAMASGAVPIVMDVSGADDDIEDDVNGFIVTQGKIDEIVDRMCRLDEDRELLRVMGRNAHETIREKMIDQNKGVSCFESLILNI